MFDLSTVSTLNWRAVLKPQVQITARTQNKELHFNRTMTDDDT